MILKNLSQQDVWRIAEMFYLQLFKDNRDFFRISELILTQLNPVKPTLKNERALEEQWTESLYHTVEV